MPNEQSPAERHIARTLTDDEGMGKPLSRRTRQTRRTVEAYLAAGVMPRYMERLREIEAERVSIRNQLARAYRRLQGACGEDRDAFARRWRQMAHAWPVEGINQLLK